MYKNLFAYFGKSAVTGYSFHESDDANAPFCVDKHCNLQSMKNSCLFSITYPDYSKLCACRSSSSVMYQGASVCFDCPVNSGHTLTGQAITACLCNLGHTGPDGRTCTACAAGKYDDRPFIVLTETKPSKRHIPVWARYSPLRTFV